MPRRLSVVVLGNSVSILQIPERPRLEDGTYGEVLADELEDAGVPTELHLEGRWFEFADQGLRRYAESLSAHAPDVVVLQYGLNEMQPWLLPVPVVRHLMTEHLTAGRPAKWYRAHVATPAWRKVRSYRRWAAERVGSRTWQMSPEKFTDVMTSVIRSARYQFRPLVLVLDVNPPGRLLRTYLPGIEQRHEVYQRLLADVVRRFDDAEVRLVPVSNVVAELGEEVALPDGIHYSAAGHRRVGELLADEVLRWLKDTGRS